MDELAFRRTVYQIAVTLTVWQLEVSFVLLTAIDVFSCQQQQEVRFRITASHGVTKGSETFMALSDKLELFLFHKQTERSKFISIKRASQSVFFTEYCQGD
jgi:hypothetical protein